VSREYGNPHGDSGLQYLSAPRHADEIDLTGLVNSRLVSFIERAKKFRVRLDNELPQGLCHLDYDKDNLLVDRHNRLSAVLDFNDLAFTPFVLDLSYTLLDVEVCADSSLAEDYLSTYEQTRSLSKLERTLIKPCKLYRHYMLSILAVREGETGEHTVGEYLAVESACLA
jgi:Ser/Thr protein kinase RdoA (MazF antagonist)